MQGGRSSHGAARAFDDDTHPVPRKKVAEPVNILLELIFQIPMSEEARGLLQVLRKRHPANPQEQEECEVIVRPSGETMLSLVFLTRNREEYASAVGDLHRALQMSEMIVEGEPTIGDAEQYTNVSWTISAQALSLATTLSFATIH